MDAQADGGKQAERRRGARVRADDPQPALKGKHTLVLTDEAWERLSVYAIKTKADCSELVEGLINAHLRGFVVQDRRATPLPARPADLSGGVKDPVETLPVGETLTPLEPGDAGPPAGEGEGSGLRGSRRRAQSAVK